MQVLLEHGADANTKGGACESALKAARDDVYHKTPDQKHQIVALLQKYGAKD